MEAVAEATGRIETARPGRFRPYPEYKDSGVEWLGEIPAHWEVKRADRCLAILKRSVVPREIPDQEVLHYSIPNVQQSGTGSVEPSATIDSSKTVIDRTSLLVSKLNPRKGTVALAKPHETLTTLASNEFIAMERRECVLEFAQYFYLSAHARLELSSRVESATRSHQRCSPDDISKLPISWPSTLEQNAIASFLGRETAKIDALVARKERLIELLQEKRTALMTRAVTRGIDPNVPMKDSGVEWLGEIPAHWAVRRTKFVARLRSGHTPSRQNPEYWRDCTIPWFALADVWQIRDGNVEYVHVAAEKISEIGIANSAARLLPRGTVILSRTASVGFSAILGVDMATTQDFVNWVCGPSLRSEYLLYVFRAMRPEFRRVTMGSTHQTIYMPDVGCFSTPIPPVPEQDQIVTFIRKEAAIINMLIAKIHRAIDHLKEFRTALISAAVTGKIDVRETASR